MNKIEAANKYSAELVPVKFLNQKDVTISVINFIKPLISAANWKFKKLAGVFAAVIRKNQSVYCSEETWSILSTIQLSKKTYSQGLFSQYVILSYFDPASNYTKKKMIIAEQGQHGEYIEIPASTVCFIEIQSFIECLKESMLDLQITHKTPSISNSVLKDFFVTVKCANESRLIRLDLALALLRHEQNQMFIPGDPIGAIINQMLGSNTWRIVFELPETEEAIKNSIATIDHIIPLSLKGQDRFVNMQIMRKDINSCKGNNSTRGEILPLESFEVLFDMAKNLKESNTQYKKQLKRLLDKEMKACSAEAKKMMAIYERQQKVIEKKLG